jgi:hypothetical protein
MDHDAFVDIGTEDDVEMGEDVDDDDDGEVKDLTSSLGLEKFFHHFEDNIEWGGHEYDHNREEAMVDLDGDHNDELSIDGMDRSARMIGCDRL